jgi:hypothetical protein
MLSRAKRLKETIDSYCNQQSQSKFQLTSSQWQQIDYLLCLTKPFFDFTNALSKSKTATIHQVFDIYDILNEHLQKSKLRLASKRVPWKKTVLEALKVSHKKLYGYHRRTIELQGNLYAIGIILAPSHKLQYFSGPTWDVHQRQKYYQIMKERFQNYAAKQGSSVQPKEQPAIQVSSLSELLRHRNPHGIPQESTELEIYLRNGMVDIDPLLYWREHHQEYPILAQIARDTLAIPATGAGVERIFNYARDICHYRRGSLKESTISNLMMYMCTSNFESKEELDQYARELAGITSSEFQINETFDLDSLISDDEAIFQIDYQNQDEQLRDEQLQDEQLQDEQLQYGTAAISPFNPPISSMDPPPARNPPVLNLSAPKRRRTSVHSLSSSDDDNELPGSSFIRSSKRTRKAPEFYEG